jgi:hypothetical protein
MMLIHRIHQNRYNRQLKEIYEILKQTMFSVNVFVDMYIEILGLDRQVERHSMYYKNLGMTFQDLLIISKEIDDDDDYSLEQGYQAINR